MTGEAGGPERTRARRWAFELLVDARAPDVDVLARARSLADEARKAAWTDVRSLADYVVVVALRSSSSSPHAWDHADTFVNWADRAEDPLPVALARCARALLSTSEHRAGHGIDDVVSAYEAAERIGDPQDQALALHQIGRVLNTTRLWELTVELHDEVERLTAAMDGPGVLAAALAYDRHVVLTSRLLHAHESGAGDTIRSHAEHVAALTRAPDHPAVADERRPDIAALLAVCRTLVAREDGAIEQILDAGFGADAARGPVGGLLHSVDREQVVGLARCVAGWRRMELGRFDEAERMVYEGAATLDSCDEPTWRTFGLWVATRLRHRTASYDARAATRRYHRDVIDARESARDALVRSVRARLKTGRLRAERDWYARESLTDALTGLANRRALDSRLAAVTPSLTMIMIDIDQFKPVNDRYGHDTGDHVLRRIGRILSDCIRPGDLAARLGGDEFVLLLEAGDREVAIRRGYEVRDRVRTEPWSELRDGLMIAVSVGVGCGARNGSELYREADEGLYRAKRAGGARVRGSWSPPALSGDDRV